MKYTRQDKTRAIIILENTKLLLGAMNDLDNYTGLDRLSRFINLGTGVKHDYEAVTWALKVIKHFHTMEILDSSYSPLSDYKNTRRHEIYEHDIASGAKKVG